MKPTSNDGQEPGSLHRMVMPRLVAKWRSEAEDLMGELGAAIDMGSRGIIRETARTLNRCARELEQKLARHNDKVSDRR